jgi:hypothetical protein
MRRKPVEGIELFLKKKQKQFGWKAIGKEMGGGKMRTGREMGIDIGRAPDKWV